MKREDYVHYVQGKRLTHAKKCVCDDMSVTDPTFAQTGRQLLTNPLPIEYRMKYPDGVPLNKENPMQFNEFDRLYPDTFKAIREANVITDKTTKQLKELQDKKPKNNPQKQPQQ